MSEVPLKGPRGQGLRMSEVPLCYIYSPITALNVFYGETSFTQAELESASRGQEICQ